MPRSAPYASTCPRPPRTRRDPIAPPASAQVSITVVDSNQNPIPAVRIDVMGRGELIAVESTSENGTADLASERWSEVRRLTLSHLAYRTLIVQVDEIPSDGVIHLEPQAVAIEGVDVAGRELCPVVESPEARSLWESVAALYSPDTENRALSAILIRRGGGVPETDLHRESTSEGRAYAVAWDGWTWHGSDHTPRPISERARTEGYAWDPVEIGGNGPTPPCTAAPRTTSRHRPSASCTTSGLKGRRTGSRRSPSARGNVTG